MASELTRTALGPNDPDDGDAGRQQRGMAIAAIVRIEKHRLGYRVPSQSTLHKMRRRGKFLGRGQTEPHESDYAEGGQGRHLQNYVATSVPKSISLFKAELGQRSGVSFASVSISFRYCTIYRTIHACTSLYEARRSTDGWAGCGTGGR